MSERNKHVSDQFDDSTQDDHSLILLLKQKIEDLTTEIHTTEEHLENSLHKQSDTATQLALHEKLSAQHQLLRAVFFGVVLLVIMMGGLVLVGWITKQTTIEREMAFFERILLVLIGIVGGAISSFFDVRNFTLSTNGNGNGNNKPATKRKMDDTE